MVLTGTFNSTRNFHYPNDTSQSWIYATAVHAPQVSHAFPLEYTPINSDYLCLSDNDVLQSNIIYLAP